MEKNDVYLVGHIKNVEKINQINGMEFEGWKAIVTTERISRKKDDVVVLIPAEMKLDGILCGEKVTVFGMLQTYKNFETGKVLVYVLAVSLEPAGKNIKSENVVSVVGTTERKATFRETPKGRLITDLFLCVPDHAGKRDCLIPCICWDNKAKKVFDWYRQKADVCARGRLQSREYEKQLPDGTREKRICYELSIQTIGEIINGETVII